MTRLREWFAGAQGTMRFHASAAAFWLLIGIFGVAQYVLFLRDHPTPNSFSPIAASIPILFLISVYANVVGHWSRYQAARTERKQDGDA